MGGHETSDSISLSIGNDVAELERLNQAVHPFLEDRNVGGKARQLIDLALEEVITNIIKYGHADNRPHEIAVRISLPPGEAVIRVEDDGHPFDPLALPPVDTSQPLDERSVGGLGIHLIRKMAKAIGYQRLAGKNRLEVRIDLQVE